MSIGMMLSNLVIGPLKLLFEAIFSISNRTMGEGFSIIALSLVVNLLVLPLYRRADALQEEERKTEERMAPMVRHIRSAFQGDEQMMSSSCIKSRYSAATSDPLFYCRLPILKPSGMPSGNFVWSDL